jgi:methionine-gamma-lyase
MDSHKQAREGTQEMASRGKAKNRHQGFATRAIHIGYEPAEENGALTPPIYMTSTFAFETAEEGTAKFAGELPGYVYGRSKNPTQSILEERIASLEGAEAGVVFGSGMGAITSPIWRLAQAGDEIVIDATLYGCTFAYFTQGISRFGVDVRPVDMTCLDELEAALSPRTKFVFFETPANPNLRVIDIERVCEMAHKVDALVMVDNTFCSPVLQRPLEFGADLVVHSATKFLGGHGDLVAGALAGSKTLIDEARQGMRLLTGATLSPMAAFLILRGLKTLELRVQRHCESALAIANLLESHPGVSWVAYPGLDSYPYRELAARQMSGFGGLIALELYGGIDSGRAFMNRLNLVTRAVSLGDAETLVQHPATMTHATYSAEERAKHGISDNLLRLSVGLETLADLEADILQALEDLPVAPMKKAV